MFVFLDDERNPQDVTWCPDMPDPAVVRYTVVRSYDEFVSLLEANEALPDHISFDHDLGETATGYDAAKWLVNFCENNSRVLPPFSCHTKNPVGRQNIESLLYKYRDHQSSSTVE